MIKKFLNRKLDKRDKKEILQATKHFRNSVICGAAYSATMFCINQVVSNEKPTELSTFLLDSLNAGLDLATFSYVDSVLATIFKPEIHSFRQWVPWAFGTSVATTFAMAAIRTPIRNYYVTGKFSMNQYFDRLIPLSIQDAVTHISLGAASIYLPPASKMGGEFARSMAIMTLGNLGGTLAYSPFFAARNNIPMKRILIDFWNRIPYYMLDHTIFLIIHNNFDKIPYSKFLNV
ncbi:hypothetical protein M9Y10_021539 [Tritrichomonas musculus]|uniref:Uncharacterized protein n=1 Tax=Tritrichomonas musculus TaxID=1915356 RepID=A0ABR2KPN7_9EUKA